MHELRDVYLNEAVRTPFGRPFGGPSAIRTDDMATLPIAELVRRTPRSTRAPIDDLLGQ
jgi:acetyl-CoA acetyltransferase